LVISEKVIPLKMRPATLISLILFYIWMDVSVILYQ